MVNSASISPESGDDRYFWRDKNNIWFLCAVLGISFMVYFPSLQNGFVNWDDSANVYENFFVTNITDWSSLCSYLKGIFTTTIIGNYNPLPILTFAIEKIVFGFDNLIWWHLDNIILHLFCVALVFRISVALGLRLIPSAFCALLFGIQPMRAESVAWITERKDLLYGVFYLLAFYFYIKSAKSSFSTRYVCIITVSYIIALFSKIQAVALPLSMLAADYYFDRKISMKLIYEKWHYFLLALLTGFAGVYFLQGAGMLSSSKFLPLSSRIFIGSYSYIVYIIKSIVPYEMVPWYPYPDNLNWIFLASMLPALLLLGSIYFFFRKKKKAIAFGLFFFTVNIIFLLQILSAGQAFLADRFTYIAYFGLFFVYAYLFQLSLGKYKNYHKFIYIAAVLVLAIYGFANFKQNTIWKNGETLWSHVLKHYPDSYIAWRARANYYRDNGKIDAALEDYGHAIALDRYNPGAYNSRGLLNSESDDPEKLSRALLDFSRAIQLSPEVSEFYFNRGLVYSKLNMFTEGLRDFDQAQKYNPGDNNIYYNRSFLYIKTGKYDKAQLDIERYLNRNPYDSDMLSNLGLVYRFNKEYDKSIAAFNNAIRMNPEKLFYYNNRMITFCAMGDIPRAEADLLFLQSKGIKEFDPACERMINQAK